MTRTPLDPAYAPVSSPTITVLAALRAYLAEHLGLPPHLIGGWEMIAQRDAVLAVYSNGGQIERGAGGVVTRQNEEVSLVFMVRSGSPVHEALLYPVRDALTHLLARFTHPLLAGLDGFAWTFDIRKDTTFTSVLTVKTTLRHRSAPAAMRGPEADLLGRAKALLLTLTHIPHTGEPHD